MARVRPDSGGVHCLPGANIHCARPSRSRQPKLAGTGRMYELGMACGGECPETPATRRVAGRRFGGEVDSGDYLVQLVDQRLRLQRERAGSMLPLVVFEQSQLQRERAQVAPIVLGAVLQRERLQRERV